MIQINKTVTFCILLCSFQLSAFSQTIIGKITDNKQQPIEGATVFYSKPTLPMWMRLFQQKTVHLRLINNRKHIT